MPGPISGAITGEDDREFIKRILAQNRPGLGEQYEKWGQEHPILQMGGEAAADYALGAFGPRALRRLPGALKTAGEIWEQAQRSGGLEGWKGGAQVAPEYREPKKKILSKMIRATQHDPQELAASMREDFARPARRQWSKVIDDNGLNGPYKLTVYRGGRSGTVPGRGRFYSPNPEFASRFTDVKKRGTGAGTHEEMVKMLKKVDAEEIEVRRPFVQRTPDEMDDDFTPEHEIDEIVQHLGLGTTEENTLKKLWANVYYPPRNHPVTKAETAGLPHETDMMKYERYISRLVRDRGYDAILKFAPDTDWWELVKLED